MSMHFSANQFEREFAAKRLGNWEVPKWFPERPRPHVHKTRIIADDRGHLLPGVTRQSEQPWDKYITAWDFPRKITRKFAQEVTGPPPRKVEAWARGPPRVVKDPPPPPPPPPRTTTCLRDDEGRPGPTELTERSSRDAASPTASERCEREGGGPCRPPTAAGPEAPPTPASSAEGRRSPHKSEGGLLQPPPEEERPSPPPPSTPSSQASDKAAAAPEARGDPCKGGELFEEAAAGHKVEEEEWEFLRRPERANEVMESKRKSTPSEGEGGLEVTGMACGRGSTPPSAATQALKAANGKPGKDMPPLATTYTPFLVAKQCAEENLRHQPLPDMVVDPSYQFMESQRAKHPGTALPVPPRATAVSIRQKHPGPTHCTKSSIFRTIKPPAETPLTSLAPLGGKDEEKTTKAYKPKITDMDLAIGWDIYAPIKSEGHHHTLGSAPSVFTIVPPPSPPEGNCGLPGGCGTPSVVAPQNSPPHRTNGIENAPCSSKQPSPPQTKPSTPPFSKPPSCQNSKSQPQQNSKPSTPLNSRTPMTSKPPTPQDNRLTRNRGSLSSWDLQNHRPPPRKAWEEKENDSPNPVAQSPNQFRGTEIRECMSNNQPPRMSQPRKRRSHSSPNLTRNPVHLRQVGSNAGAAFHKACTACHENSKADMSPKNSESSGYKMAFKAGKPSNNRPMTAHPAGGSGSTSSTSQGEAAKVKVPKPRAPFARRSYSISTLAPPFSLWPGNHKRGGREYPDHWRLASVYQHAFKPISNRTRPLLSTVYQ